MVTLRGGAGVVVVVVSVVVVGAVVTVTTVVGTVIVVVCNARNGPMPATALAATAPATTSRANRPPVTSFCFRRLPLLVELLHVRRSAVEPLRGRRGAATHRVAVALMRTPRTAVDRDRHVPRRPGSPIPRVVADPDPPRRCGCRGRRRLCRRRLGRNRGGGRRLECAQRSHPRDCARGQPACNDEEREQSPGRKSLPHTDPLRYLSHGVWPTRPRVKPP
jgi:hypothetical protein